MQEHFQIFILNLPEVGFTKLTSLHKLFYSMKTICSRVAAASVRFDDHGDLFYSYTCTMNKKNVTVRRFKT